MLSGGPGALAEIHELGDRTAGSDGVPDGDDVARLLDGDLVGGSAVCRVRHVDAPDRDGDGIPDAWERAGETPDGAALPGADPARKDLYVQLNHGSNVDPLTDAERRQLRAVWARMPVENPDGSTGVSVHLVRGGDLGEPAVFAEGFSPDRYYTRERLGARRCVYRQVTYGRIEAERIEGKATGPGYTAAVEGRWGTREVAYSGDVSPRVAVTTHELLHTAAGPVDGQAHTSSGWLAPNLRPDGSDEHLSASTARHLNRTGIHGPAA